MKKTSAKAIRKPQRTPKGLFKKGNTVGVDSGGGRPCEYCPKHEEIITKINLYIEYCKGSLDQKIHPPFLEELCGFEYLDILVSDLDRWIDNAKPMPHDKNHKEELHSALKQTVKRVVQRQKQFLLNHSLFNNQVSGAIFQLKANHGMIETEKRILAGTINEPLNIVITEEENRHTENE